jgi:hypothetical protein
MINLVFLRSFENQNQNYYQNQYHQKQNHIKTKIQNQNFKTSFGFGACLAVLLNL